MLIYIKFILKRLILNHMTKRNMMKNILLVLVSTLVFSLSSLVMAAPTIQFSGEVSTETCVPTINGNENGTVLLAPVLASIFTGTVTTAGKTNFNIGFAGSCTSVKGIILAGYSVTAGILGNIASGTTAANNIGLEILDSNGVAVVLSGPTRIAITPTNNSATLGVQYKSTGTPIRAGIVKATAEYTITYQ
ncbi:hypothetical protein B9T31_02870 [Acinetobacter sp. ANC 4558]|nr:hypothetical protein B9T31_02870 [Acinetobacter sp. ANC 4558]